MTPTDASTGPGDQPAFTCSWRPEGVDAATVVASGSLERAGASQLELAIAEAAAHARLVLVDVHGASFVDSAGARAIAAAAASASRAGARLVVVGAPDMVQAALRGPGAGAEVEVLDPAPIGSRRHRESFAAHEAEELINPFDNPVNASVLTARAMSIAAQELWFQGDDGSVGRAWAPPTGSLPVPPGTPVEVYLDDEGDVNGWREPTSGLAVNQRLFDPLTAPETASSAVCQGPCGVVWQAPAATQLTEHAERCLTCSGPLVLG